MKRTLTKAQERRLNRKHLVGDFGPGSWKTIESLIRDGYLIERDRNLVMTAKGHDYCETFRTTLPV